MAKKDLIAVIVSLESELNAEGVTFESKGLTEKDFTEIQLKEEIERLEALLPDGDEGGEGSGEITGSTGGQDEVSAGAEEVWNIELRKGVNIQTVKNGQRTVLEGGKTHPFSIGDAKEILAKNLGIKKD